MLKSASSRNIPLATPVLDDEMEKAALNALRNERFVLGEEVFKFEEEFARYVDTKYAVSTSSGTNALHLSLLSLGVSSSDEVITTPFSFIATSNAILHANAIPVFADIDAKTYCIDPEETRRKTTSRTKVLLPVHLYGYPSNMSQILEIAEKNNLHVIEDACQAHGAEFNGRKTGSIGKIGCFSFYPSKNMTVCGDGGMITTNDKEVADRVAKLRDCGRKSKYEHDVVGYTSRLNTVNAAIGRVQLRRLDEWNRKRVENASIYSKLLSDIDEITLPPAGDSQIKPVYHLYVIRTRLREKLSEWLEGNGVQCGIHYPLPIHLQPIYRELFGFAGGEYPISEAVSQDCLSLPISSSLSNDDARYVCEKIHEFYKKVE